MARQNISTGTVANDRTGDTLRQAGQKINENFVELYRAIGGDSDQLSAQITIEDSAVAFDGATIDTNKTRLTASDVTTNRIIRLPDASGVVTLNDATQTLTNKSITSATLTTPKVVTSINDTNSNELIKVTATSSAVNEFTVTNAAAGNSPAITATGDDTNINLRLLGKGSGSVLAQKIAFGSDEITANGTIPGVESHVICNKDTALALTLSDGTTLGEVKLFSNKGAGVATITPDNGDAFSLSEGGAAQVVWNGVEWIQLVGGGNITVTGIQGVAEDSSPQLGGTLDANGFNIDMGINIITDSSISEFEEAYGWGDHALAGYMSNLVDDSTPELGGNLQAYAHGIEYKYFITNTVDAFVYNDSSSRWFPGGNVEDPVLYLRRGDVYRFEVNTPGIPFNIFDSSGGTQYSVGVTNNGDSSGDVVFAVAMAAPATLYYTDSASGSRGNVINIV